MLAKLANKEKVGQLGWVLVWLVILAVLVVFQSGFYNFDSFKYVSIASAMLSQHHYILPTFDGKPYSDKGPILFWLFILGWKFTGINHWWPQLLMALTASVGLVLTIKIADILWPDQPRIKQLLPIVLLSLPSWIVLTNEIRVDIFLMVFCLMAFLSLLFIIQGKKQYWFLYSVSLTLGFLCKGPVILIYTLLPAIVLPIIFTSNQSIPRKSWYSYLTLSTLVAIGLALSWAIPAALQGGHTYYQSIFFQQVYGRAFQNYSFLYYILRLPLFILPWCLYLPFLLGSFKYSKLLNPERFCWAIIIISFAVFSFYGQKRVHYLNPDFPLFALIITRAISNYMTVHSKPVLSHQWFFGIILLLSAGAILWLPHLSITFDPAIQAQLFYILKYNIFIAILLLVLSWGYFFYCPNTIKQQMMMIMVPTAAVSTVLLVLRVVA